MKTIHTQFINTTEGEEDITILHRAAEHEISYSGWKLEVQV